MAFCLSHKRGSTIIAKHELIKIARVSALPIVETDEQAGKGQPNYPSSTVQKVPKRKLTQELFQCRFVFRPPLLPYLQAHHRRVPRQPCGSRQPPPPFDLVKDFLLFFPLSLIRSDLILVITKVEQRIPSGILDPLAFPSFSECGEDGFGERMSTHSIIRVAQFRSSAHPHAYDEEHDHPRSVERCRIICTTHTE